MGSPDDAAHPLAPAAPVEGPGKDRGEQALLYGAVDSLPEGGLQAKLAGAASGSRQLRVKLGIDPTAPDIHLGHAVVLKKLRQFQDLGHRVVLIVGDCTAQVGDPSGRSALRPVLSPEEIERNAATFADQATKILDPSPERLEIRRNSQWLQMALGGVLELLRTTTVAQLLEREDFAKRWHSRRPISMLELVYPLLQGYDSVAVQADIEVGGTDQKFNLLLGRDIQRAYGQESQAILTMPILVGTDGKRKMSKSLGNHIGLTDPPAEMFGKTMSLPDEAMAEYFSLLLFRAPPALPPRDAKRELARGIVSWLHSPQMAKEAESEFDRLFIRHQPPDELPDCFFPAGQDSVHLPAVISESFRISRSEARRLLTQGAVQLAGSRLGPDDQDLPVEKLDGAVLQVGKRRFCRLRATP